MKLKKISVFCLFFLASCVPMPNTEEIMNATYNVPFEKVSEFDGTKYFGVNNCWCGESLSFDLFQSDKSAELNEFVIKARVTGTENIGDNESLHFNVDGEIFSFSTTMAVTNFEKAFPQNHILNKYSVSTKKYLVPISFLEKVSTAQKVVAKIDHDISRTFTEGVCTPNEEWGEKYVKYSGVYGFKKFYSMVNNK